MRTGRCIKCGCLWMSLGAALAVFADDSGICTPCREVDEFGTPLEFSDKLRVVAAAQRAQYMSSDGSIRCLAAGCLNTAREWWYVCSRECRDRLVQEYQNS